MNDDAPSAVAEGASLGQQAVSAAGTFRAAAQYM